MYNEKKSIPVTDQTNETLPFQKNTTKIVTIPKDSKYPELHGELFLG